MGILSSLSREQKTAIGLLQMGTFFEYFDLMLYVHMAVVLNEIFFPKTDPHTASLLASFVFCSTFVFIPIGALVFGWVGDNIGRKSTIIITTMMMSLSCLVMANLPTYEQIGIAASWGVMLCRISQGISSMGEIIGAQIYVTESLPRPIVFPAVGFIVVTATLGGMVALCVATLVMSYGMSWRVVFWVGAGIAIVSTAARTRLRETPEFLKLKKQQMKQAIEALNVEIDPKGAEFNASWKEPIEKKTLASYFMIYCGFPLCFFLTYMYFTPILKESFGYSTVDIVQRNFFLASLAVLGTIFFAYLSYWIHPLKIIKARGIFLLVYMAAMPFLVTHVETPTQLFLIQAVLVILPLDSMPAGPVFISHLPLYRRSTSANILYALSRALVYIISSFGLVYLGHFFGPYGLLFMTLPVTLGYLYGVRHFERLEGKYLSPHKHAAINV